MRRVFLSLFIFSATLLQAQKLKKEDLQLKNNLQAHINFLAAEKLEGRRTGTEGERLAALYISDMFKREGLQSKGTNEYYQAFTISEGQQINKASLLINSQALTLNKDFFPLSFSGNGAIKATSSLSLQESGTPWFLDVKEMLEENRNNPHYDLAEALQKRISDMQSKGATAVLIYNTSSIEDGITFEEKDKTTKAKIPVVYLSKEAAKKFMSDESASHDINITTDLGPKIRKGTNVVGYINNGAPMTVIIGAHYDHLGRGEDGNSMLRSGPKQIHPGADDNASGTAALIELAKLLKGNKYKNDNYLLIAFSGEELGLYGSKYFTEHPAIDLSSVDYMINMDMVGRLNDSTHAVTVGGYGTTPTWRQLYSQTGKHKLYSDNLVFKYDSSGIGPSDHTSFYLKNIPVLFYFTGIHKDYHKPGDEASKINYTGEVYVIKHILSLIEQAGKNKQKLAFTKTRDTQMGSNTKFSVTLGIMPDYTFSGTGVRVDDVSENRPAKKAGLQAGDVITALGENKIFSLETYMQALGKFKKGDKTRVTYNRSGQSHEAAIEF